MKPLPRPKPPLPHLTENERAVYGQKLIRLVKNLYGGSNDRVFFYIDYCMADLRQKDPDTGATALIYAVQRHNIEVIEYLIKKGARLDDKDNNGDTAYQHALAIRNPEMLKIFDRINKRREKNMRGLEENGLVLKKRIRTISRIKTGFKP